MEFGKSVVRWGARIQRIMRIFADQQQMVPAGDRPVPAPSGEEDPRISAGSALPTTNAVSDAPSPAPFYTASDNELNVKSRTFSVGI